MIKFEKIILDPTTTPPLTAMKALEKLDARVAFSARGPTMVRNREGVWEPSTETGKTRCAIATIIDNATGESYAHGEGDSDELALRGAIEAANTMPKPMTKAQKNSPQFLELQQTVKDQAKRIADLEASMRVKPTPPLDSVESGAEPNPPAALTRGQRAAQTRAANAAKRVAEQAA